MLETKLLPSAICDFSLAYMPESVNRKCFQFENFCLSLAYEHYS